MLLSRPWLKVFSSLFVNLAAVWLAAAVISPGLAGLTGPFAAFELTADVLAAIVSLYLAAKTEELLEK